MALARINLVLQEDDGDVVDGASVEVRNEATLALAPVFSDRAGASSLGNPFTATDGADAGFYVAGGAYKITATLGAFSKTIRYQAVGTSAEKDYEEGSWTPTIGFVTSNGNLNVVYSVREGRYVKIGKLVWVNFQIITSTFTHTTASGDLTVTGLPFTIEANGECFCPLIINGHTGPVGTTQWTGDFLGTSTQIMIIGSGVGGAGTTVKHNDMPTGATIYLQGSGSYRAVS
jgi:hypothetical protein